jgi:hypothetical protein
MNPVNIRNAIATLRPLGPDAAVRIMRKAIASLTREEKAAIGRAFVMEETLHEVLFTTTLREAIQTDCCPHCGQRG